MADSLPSASNNNAAMNPQSNSQLCSLPHELLVLILNLMFQEQFPFTAGSELDNTVELSSEDELDSSDSNVDGNEESEANDDDGQRAQMEVEHDEPMDEVSDSGDSDFENNEEIDDSDGSEGSLDSEGISRTNSPEAVSTRGMIVPSEHLQQLADHDPETVVRSSYFVPAILQSCRLLRSRGRESFLQCVSDDALQIQREKSVLTTQHRDHVRGSKWQKKFSWPPEAKLLRLRERASDSMQSAIDYGGILAPLA